MYKVITKLRILNGRFSKDKHTGKTFQISLTIAQLNSLLMNKQGIRLDPRKDEFELIRSDNTDERNQLISEKKLSESYLDLNNELEKDQEKVLSGLQKL